MTNENGSKKIEIMEEESLEKEKFNSITNSKKVENQNQHHNIRRQGLGQNVK